MSTSSATTDVIVIGCGVIGSNTAYQLAKRGAGVRVIERNQIGHALGSSHGPSRIIRLAYDQREYVVLAQAAYAAWRALEAEAGVTLMHCCGGLDFGPADALGLREIGENYRHFGIEHEQVDGAEIMRRFPQFRLHEDTLGFYQADYSMLAADDCVRTAAHLAERHGAQIHTGEGVQAVEAEGSGVVVRTDRGVYRAAQVVLCAGSWMPPLLRALGLELPLTVTKEQVLFMAARHPEHFAIGRFPLYIHRIPGSTSLGSGFPVLGHRGPKLMIDRIGPLVESDDPDRSIDAVNLERVRQYATDLLPDLTGDVIEAVSCRYTMTPDEDFVIDLHPEHSQIVVASPCSGHGFKFGSVIGSILADLALNGATQHDLSRFRLARFQ
jgi:sarcosine oxidase